MEPKFIYLKSEMTELDQRLDTQMPMGKVDNLHKWVPRVHIHVYIVGLSQMVVSCKVCPTVCASEPIPCPPPAPASILKRAADNSFSLLLPRRNTDSVNFSVSITYREIRNPYFYVKSPNF